MMFRLRTAARTSEILGAALVVLMAAGSGLALAAPPMLLEVTPAGGVAAYGPDGSRRWEVRRPFGDEPLSYAWDAQGHIVLDGTDRVDHYGRLIDRVVRQPAGQAGDRTDGPAAAVTNPAWDPPVEISGGLPFQFQSDVAPVIDSNGDAWVIMHGQDMELPRTFTIQVTRSDGHTGVWSPPEILHMVPEQIFVPAMVIDSSDRITVVFRQLSGTMNLIQVLRYEPGLGWSGPRTIYSTSEFFQQVDAAVDAMGNVVVSFDPDADTMVSLIYDVATDIWSDVIPVSPPAAEVFFATLVANRSGSHLYAIYWAPDAAAQSVYVRRFRSPALGWAPPRRVPGSGRGVYPGLTGPTSFIPATVDDQGTLTVPYYVVVPLSEVSDLWVLLASRLEAGAWVGPAVAMLHLNLEPEFVNFADADTGPTGDVLIVFKRLNRPSESTRLHAAYYDADAGGWAPPTTLYEDTIGSQQRSRVAFRGDGSAVATYLDFNGPATKISSRLFDGSAWVDGALPIPGDPVSNLNETTADGLDVLMVYGDTAFDGIIYATWLR